MSVHSSCRLGLGFLALMWCEVVLANPVFTPWAGQLNASQPVVMRSVLSLSNPEVQGQLRPTCLEGMLQDVNAEPGLQRRVDLAVQTRPLGKDKVEVLLAARQVLSEPVVRLVLESRCPLVSFRQTWMLSLQWEGVSDPAMASADSRGEGGPTPDAPAEPELLGFVPKPNASVLRSFKPQTPAPAAVAKANSLPDARAVAASPSERRANTRPELTAAPASTPALPVKPQDPAPQTVMAEVSTREKPIPASSESVAMAKVDSRPPVQAALPSPTAVDEAAYPESLTDERSTWVWQVLLVSSLLALLGLTYQFRAMLPLGGKRSRVAPVDDSVRVTTQFAGQAEPSPEISKDMLEGTMPFSPALGNGQTHAGEATANRQLFESFLDSKGMAFGLGSESAAFERHSVRTSMPELDRSTEAGHAHSNMLGAWELPEQFARLIAKPAVCSVVDQTAEHRLGFEVAARFIEWSSQRALKEVEVDPALCQEQFHRIAQQALAVGVVDWSLWGTGLPDLVRDCVRASVVELKSETAFGHFKQALWCLGESLARLGCPVDPEQWQQCLD